MDPIQYLKAIRRRWVVIVAAVALSLGAGWLTTRSASSAQSAAPASVAYQATAILVNNGTSSSTLASPSVAASFATAGEVPVRVAESLDYQGDPIALAATVQAAAEPETGLLRITTTQPNARQAEQVANAFAEELISFLERKFKEMNVAAAERIQADIEVLQGNIVDLEQRIGIAPTAIQAGLLRDQRSAAQAQATALSEQYQQLVSRSPQIGLGIIQEGFAQPISSGDPGIQAPSGRLTRLALAGLLGLVGGLGLALVLARFDTRIYSKEEIEEHFDLPVVAEIPRAARQHTFMGDPAASLTSFADSFRLLAAEISRRSSSSSHALTTDGSGRPGLPLAKRTALTILVTSAAPDEGKTLVVSNLATSFAEIGKDVLILSCDFHRPHVHDIFGVTNEAGLSEALSAEHGAPVLNGHVKRTNVDKVKLVPTGSVTGKPGELFTSSRMRRALDEARQMADVVLIDSAPVMMGGDATLLVSEVDAVLVVARSGITTVELAERSGDYLKRLNAPLLGVAFNGSSSPALPRSSYASVRRHAKHAVPDAPDKSEEHV